SRAQHSRSRSTGPRRPLTDRTHATQSRGDTTRLRGPMRCCKSDEQERDKKNLQLSTSRVSALSKQERHKQPLYFALNVCNVSELTLTSLHQQPFKLISQVN